MSWPSAIGARSTSIGAPAAIVEASGFIWEMSGQTTAAAPTAATAPVATNRKSRRVCSAEDVVVTILSPFLVSTDGPSATSAQFKRQPAPRPHAARDQFVPSDQAEQAVQNRSIGTLDAAVQAYHSRNGMRTPGWRGSPFRAAGIVDRARLIRAMMIRAP